MSSEWGGGKGDKSRPLSISYEEYANRFDNIFRRNKEATSSGSNGDSEMETLSSFDCGDLDDIDNSSNDENK